MSGQKTYISCCVYEEDLSFVADMTSDKIFVSASCHACADFVCWHASNYACLAF